MMKKIMVAAALSVASVGAITALPQACTAISSSAVGVSVIKSALLMAIRRTENTYATPQAFLQDDKVLDFLPNRLRTVYNGLQRLSPETAGQLKNYMADAGVQGVKLAAPILKNSVNRLTGDDVRRIMEGTPGTATQVLKEKAEAELFATLRPRVEAQLQRSGVAGIVDTAARGGSLLGLFGQNASGEQMNAELSSTVTHQIIDGLFVALRKYEVENHADLYRKH